MSLIPPDVAAAMQRILNPGATWPTPGDLARHLNPHIRQTPALDLIDAELARLINTPDGRLIISMSPQEGKSQRASRAFPLWALLRNPDTRVAIASYEHGVARRWGRAIRDDLTTHRLGLRIRDDLSAQHEWQLSGREGGVYSVGIGAALTGRPVDLLIIDDPIKDRQQADSKTFRDRVWDWWTEVGATRLAPGAPVVAIQCMTGDTPVLMADGTERQLRTIRVGDEVATYENGAISTSVVRNWANQGPDNLFRVRMKSGRVIRANARHPFLTITDDGVETWLRTDQIRPGQSILTVTGASGAESRAPLTDATHRPGARECAVPTTTRPDGQRVFDPHPSTQYRAEGQSSSTATSSLTPRLTTSLSSSTDSAPSASSRHQPRTPAHTGMGNSAWTTTTTRARFEDSSATTATLQSDTENLPKCSVLPLTTWSVTPDEVESVEPCGREDVYDIQVDRTENFIANGLVSHNTRWHEDDLAGRLLAAEDGHLWRVINIPAQCDNPDTDPLGRAAGEFMESARGRTREQWEAIKTRSGPRTWASLYQGRPAPSEGALFRRDAWQRYDRQPWLESDGVRMVNGGDRLIQSWDLSFKGSKTADWVVGQVWWQRGAEYWLLDQMRGRWGFSDTCERIRAMSARWPQTTAKLVEDKANGPAVIDALKRTVSGLVPVNPAGGKESRAAAVEPFVAAGNVHLPASHLAPWVDDLIEEAAAFPNAAHDDQVDALSQALTHLGVTQPTRRVGTGFFNIG